MSLIRALLFIAIGFVALAVVRYVVLWYRQSAEPSDADEPEES